MTRSTRNSAGGRPAAQGRRVTRRIGLALSVTVPLVVAAAALLLLSHGSRGGHPASGRGAVVAGESSLRARIGQLRRPQTATDRLPNGPAERSGRATILRPASRLVARRDGLRIFLVVERPFSGVAALWSPALGDQLAVFAIGRGGTFETDPSRAANLANPTPQLVAFRHSSRTPVAVSLLVQPIPDGVARVRWTLAGGRGNSGGSGSESRTITVPVHRNLAVLRVSSTATSVRHATWLTVGGRPVPTSATPLQRAQAAQRRAQRSRALRIVRASHRPASAALLGAYSAFAVHSRTPVTVAPGTTVTHPRLAAIPTDVMTEGVQGGGGIVPDLSEARKVRTRSGVIGWLIPAARTLCVVFTHVPGEPGGATMTFAPDLHAAERRGLYGTFGGRFAIGVAPTARTSVPIMVGGKHRTAHPVEGVFAVRR